MPQRVEKSYCRICSGLCGVLLTIDQDDRIVSIKGDKAHPLSRGYFCIKGSHAVDAHYDKARLLHPLKRNADGSFSRIPLEQALDEIGEKLSEILHRDGPDAVAAYRGTINVYSALASTMLPDWLHSLGSTAFYSTMTIDQSAKWVTYERLGAWMAGRQSIDDADVMMLVGINPLVSIAAPGLMHNPVKTLKDAKARGMKLIVIDPRRTETAVYADLHLQPPPGQDAVLAAGLLRIILTQNWHNTDFCKAYVQNLDALRAHVEPFTPELVERRTGISANDLYTAAEMFAGQDDGLSKRGIAHAGTGVAMSANGNLADHLFECLNVVCGRFLLAGETAHVPGLFAPAGSVLEAGVIPAARSWETGWKSRIGGYGMLFGERMTIELADEIITPGPGQIKSLFVDGGNPVGAIPDQKKVVEAFRRLELLVTIDPFMSSTAKLSHYILPPKTFYEHADLLVDRNYEPVLIPKPVAQYTPALVAPPPGSDLVEDWYVFWALAKRLGIRLRFDGVDLNMQSAPTTDDLHALLLRNSRVSFDEVRERRGELLDIKPVTVRPASAQNTGRFAVAPDDVCADLMALAGPAPISSETSTRFSHLLVSRRMRAVSNTMYQQLPETRRRVPYNPVCVHPGDLVKIGLEDGNRAEIISEHGRVTAIVKADETMKPGVVSMTHGWGLLPDEDADCEACGTSVSLLISSSKHLESINAMPRLSGIPVRLEPLR